MKQKVEQRSDRSWTLHTWGTRRWLGRKNGRVYRYQPHSLLCRGHWHLLPLKCNKSPFLLGYPQKIRCSCRPLPHLNQLLLSCFGKGTATSLIMFPDPGAPASPRVPTLWMWVLLLHWSYSEPLSSWACLCSMYQLGFHRELCSVPALELL